MAAQIANMHTLFNIVTTVLLIPFGNYLASFAERVLPDKKEETLEGMHLEFIRPVDTKRENHIGTSAIVLTGVRKEVGRMLQMTKENVSLSFDAVLESSSELLKKVDEKEEYIDFLNKEICKYISKVIVNETNRKDAKYMSALFKVCGNLERIGIMRRIFASTRNDGRKGSLSQTEMDEIRQMKEASLSALNILSDIEKGDKELVKRIEKAEQQIDDMTEMFRQGQIDRMQQAGRTRRLVFSTPKC